MAEQSSIVVTETIRGRTRTATTRVDLGDPVWTPDELRALHVGLSKAVLREEQRKGFDPDPRVIVDRRGFDRPEETVKLFGRIEYFARSPLKDIIVDALEYLERISPLDTGRYISGHTLLINGREVDFTRGVLGLDIGQGDRVQIVNTMPYARKIEQGSSLQAPTGVYQKLFGYMKRKYGKLVFVKQRWVQLAIPPSAARTRGRQGWEQQRAYRYPAIELRQSRGGARL